MYLVLGALLTSAIILIEVGIGDIFLSRDMECREMVYSSRILSDPELICLPEGVHYFLRALSRGPFASVNSEVSSPIAWIVLWISYAILGGLLAIFPSRSSIGIFLGVHIFAITLFTFLAYLSNFLA